MFLEDESLLNKLCEENPKFRVLFEEHIRFEQDLEALYSMNSSSSEIEQNIKEIKVLKLRGKDMMEQIISEYKRKLKN